MNVSTKHELIAYFEAKVAEIPEMRQCLAYNEELALQCLTYFRQNMCGIHTRMELMVVAMQITKGQANPAFMNKLIVKWLELPPETLLPD